MRNHRRINMNAHQLKKKNAKTVTVTETVVTKTEPAKVANPIKDFIKSITPEQAPNAIKPSDFIPGRKKTETK